MTSLKVLDVLRILKSFLGLILQIQWSVTWLLSWTKLICFWKRAAVIRNIKLWIVVELNIFDADWTWKESFSRIIGNNSLCELLWAVVIGGTDFLGYPWQTRTKKLLIKCHKSGFEISSPLIKGNLHASWQRSHNFRDYKDKVTKERVAIFFIAFHLTLSE